MLENPVNPALLAALRQWQCDRCGKSAGKSAGASALWPLRDHTPDIRDTVGWWDGPLCMATCRNCNRKELQFAQRYAE